MKVLNPDGGRGPWRPGGPDGAFMTLCYFIHERERIRLRRESGTPGPWTKDPILRDAFFTNVDRRSDFGTRWFVDNVYAHRKDDIDLVRRILTCRLINRIDTIRLLGVDRGRQPWPVPQKAREKLLKAAEAGAPVLAIAHMTATPHDGERSEPGTGLRRWVDEVLLTAWREASLIARALSEPGAGLRDAFAAFKSLPCVGDFLANQLALDLSLCADLGHTGLLADAGDKADFAHPGPGAKAMLRELETPMTAAGVLRIRDLLNEAFFGIRRLEAQDVEHALCEAWKYTKILRGGRIHRRWSAERTAR